MIQVISITINAVNLYLLDTGACRFLIDTGFPGSMPALGRALRQYGLKVRNIDYVMVTHFHIDHAGSLQELKDEGVRAMVVDVQQPFIAPMEHMAAGKWPYRPLRCDDNMLISATDARNFLAGIGIMGNIIPVSVHSEDSVCMLLDMGAVFTGDLPAPALATAYGTAAEATWHMLKEMGANTVYPGHGQAYIL
ncbi:MBL fold metallo-hydrolase [Nemorincola caseinilytica]|uniref:MBL fold metallo-hydrolase n=1 Tax=Nemorincola caseinilytica TaxID=2054315 RepID=A0ABP8NCD7_9BACT